MNYDLDDLIVMSYEDKQKVRYGIFNLELNDTFLASDIPNGEYLNYVNRGQLTVENNKIIINNNPLIFDVIK